MEKRELGYGEKGGKNKLGYGEKGKINKNITAKLFVSGYFLNGKFPCSNLSKTINFIYKPFKCVLSLVCYLVV